MAYIRVPSLEKMLDGVIYEDDPKIYPVMRASRSVSALSNWAQNHFCHIFFARKTDEGSWAVRRLLAGFDLKDFTGNCGAKAFNGLSLCNTGMSLPESRERELKKHMLFLIETYAYVLAEASMLVGSDNSCGSVITLVKQFGKGYKFGDEIWNSRYDKGHNIRLFYKDMNEQRSEYQLEYKNWQDL